MNNYLFSGIIFVQLILLIIDSPLSSSKDIELTEKQIAYAEEISKPEGILDAEWINSYTLQIKLNPEIIGPLTEAHGKERAEIISKYGYSYTGKDICVKVILPDLNELAYKCVGDNKEI